MLVDSKFVDLWTRLNASAIFFYLLFLSCGLFFLVNLISPKLFFNNTCILGPGLSIAGTFFFIDLIISEHRHKTLQTPHSSLETTRLWLLANFYFFATGNTTTFSGVPFNVAGIGLISWPTLVIPGFLVLFNYIGSYLFILAYLTR